MTTVLCFATRTPPIPVTVDIFETRRPETSSKVTTVLRFATIRTPRIPVTVDTFETRRPETSPKVTTVLHFATIRTPRIPVIVDTFETRRPETNPKVTTVLRFAAIFVSPACPTLRERLRTLMNACERLRTLADACVTNATTSRRLLAPWTPTLKREPFCGAFGN